MAHSSIQVTLDPYGHPFPQSRREAASKLQAAMGWSKDKANGSGPQHFEPETFDEERR
jgi:hypothetical protein